MPIKTLLDCGENIKFDPTGLQMTQKGRSSAVIEPVVIEKLLSLCLNIDERLLIFWSGNNISMESVYEILYYIMQMRK